MGFIRAVLIATSVSCVAMSASAQNAPPPDGPPHSGPKATILFLAPYGKPFRTTFDGPASPTSMPSQMWFKATDSNQDAALSEDEFMQAATAFFEEVDLNHDGVISDPENRNYENKIVRELIGPINMPNGMGNMGGSNGKGGKGGPPPGGMGGGGMGGGGMGGGGSPPNGDHGGVKGDFTPMTNSRGAEPFSLMKEPQAIRASDANFDFRISKDEWNNANQERFDVLDKDHDRQLRLIELPQTQIEQRLMTPPDPKEMKKKRN